MRFCNKRSQSLKEKSPLHTQPLHKLTALGNSLAFQWLGLRAFTAKVPGSIPGRGNKIPQAVLCGQKTNSNNNKKLTALSVAPSSQHRRSLHGCCTKTWSFKG